MTNLLEETIKFLSEMGKQEADVLWVGQEHGAHMSWDEFKRRANFEYDSGFGGQEILSDLVVVGKDWWLERYEYDGSEWWGFKSHPVKPEKHDPKVQLGWTTIEYP